MLAICDVNEYRKCVKEFGIPVVSQLFNTLHHLCNLLVVVPENLTQACTEEQLVGDGVTMYTVSEIDSYFKGIIPKKSFIQINKHHSHEG